MKRIVATRIAAMAFLAVGGVAAAGEGVARELLHYQDAIVRLSGIIVVEHHYGPPNYGEHPGTDSKEDATILLLDEPVSVEGDPDDELNSESVSDVAKIQLVAAEFAKLLLYPPCKHVTLEGTLFHSHTAHHRTDVLMTVTKVIAASP